MNLKRYFLLFASSTVSIIALLYGVSPSWFARTFLAITNLDAGVAHILRAIMGLYLAFGLFWSIAAFNAKFRDAAILTTIFFSGGLVSGRLLSLGIEGMPAPLLCLYLFMELGLVPVALWVYRLPDK